MGRILNELEKIYGVQVGNNQHTTNGGNLTQKDIAKTLGIDEESYRRYKKLTTLIPEIQNLVDDTVIAKSEGNNCPRERTYFWWWR